MSRQARHDRILFAIVPFARLIGDDSPYRGVMVQVGRGVPDVPLERARDEEVDGGKMLLSCFRPVNLHASRPWLAPPNITLPFCARAGSIRPARRKRRPYIA